MPPNMGCLSWCWVPLIVREGAGPNAVHSSGSSAEARTQAIGKSLVTNADAQAHSTERMLYARWTGSAIQLLTAALKPVSTRGPVKPIW